jgi:hypothetical protein
MGSPGIVEQLDGIVARLKAAGWKDRDAVREELLRVALAAADRAVARDHLESIKGALGLELRWEVEEVIEALTPPPAPVEKPPEPPPAEEDPNKPLTAADLKLVYHDPRGLMIHKTKKGNRWLATEVDPRSGKPMTYELRANEIEMIKTQLKGSPYWVLGSGETPGA